MAEREIGCGKAASDCSKPTILSPITAIGGFFLLAVLRGSSDLNKHFLTNESGMSLANCFVNTISRKGLVTVITDIAPDYFIRMLQT